MLGGGGHRAVFDIIRNIDGELRGEFDIIYHTHGSILSKHFRFPYTRPRAACRTAYGYAYISSERVARKLEHLTALILSSVLCPNVAVHGRFDRKIECGDLFEIYAYLGYNFAAAHVDRKLLRHFIIRRAITRSEYTVERRRG